MPSGSTSPTASSFLSSLLTPVAPPIVTPALSSSIPGGSALSVLTPLRSEQGGKISDDPRIDLFSAAVPQLYHLGTLLSRHTSITSEASNPVISQIDSTNTSLFDPGLISPFFGSALAADAASCAPVAAAPVDSLIAASPVDDSSSNMIPASSDDSKAASTDFSLFPERSLASRYVQIVVQAVHPRLPFDSLINSFGLRLSSLLHPTDEQRLNVDWRSVIIHEFLLSFSSFVRSYDLDNLLIADMQDICEEQDAGKLYLRLVAQLIQGSIFSSRFDNSSQMPPRAALRSASKFNQSKRPVAFFLPLWPAMKP